MRRQAKNGGYLGGVWLKIGLSGFVVFVIRLYSMC